MTKQPGDFFGFGSVEDWSSDVDRAGFARQVRQLFEEVYRLRSSNRWQQPSRGEVP